MASLNEFLAAVKTEGLMRTNRFSVFFNIPASVQQNFDLRKVMLYCEAAALPGVTLETAQAKVFGEFREMPYGRLFDNVNLTFYVDNAMTVKSVFDEWINSIQNPETRAMNYYKNYITDVEITVYDLAEKQRYTVTLYEAYPKSLSPITMDYKDKDVMRMNVSMNYKYWKASPVSAIPSASGATNSPAGLLDSALQNSGFSGTGFKVPTQYFTNFNSYQTGFQSFEQGRANLFSSATSQGVSNSTGIQMGSLKLF